MDELLVMMKTLLERVDRIEASIEELKTQQRPLSSKDYIHSLKLEKGVELDHWLKTIKITAKDVRALLEEKNIMALMSNLDYQDCMRVFSNNKNTVYCYSGGNWKTLTKPLIDKIKNGIFTKTHKEYCAMKKNNSQELNRESLKDLSYIEQRGILNTITEINTTKFKNDLYKHLKDYTAS
jgi:hypothetical protein